MRSLTGRNSRNLYACSHCKQGSIDARVGRLHHALDKRNISLSAKHPQSCRHRAPHSPGQAREHSSLPGAQMLLFKSQAGAGKGTQQPACCAYDSAQARQGSRLQMFKACLRRRATPGRRAGQDRTRWLSWGWKPPGPVPPCGPAGSYPSATRPAPASPKRPVHPRSPSHLRPGRRSAMAAPGPSEMIMNFYAGEYPGRWTPGFGECRVENRRMQNRRTVENRGEPCRTVENRGL